jgi:hypothetical protein
MDNIKMNFGEIGRRVIGWIHLAWGPVGGSCVHGNELSGSIKFGEILE